LNSKFPAFNYYGGRGITVCARWLNSFENFLEDMGQRPKGSTLDRWPDLNGNYEPSNCRWATKIEQANNRRGNLFLIYEGQSKTVAQWAREKGFDRNKMYRSLKRGWDVGKVMSAL
jgi:hypothetical protein